MEKVIAENGGERVDVYLAAVTGKTRSQISKALILVNGEKVKLGTKLRARDIIEFELLKEVEVQAEDIAIDVVYEDEHLMVINKPRGLVVHPGAGNRSGTLLNGLLHFNSGLERAGIVHRLDKNTAGLLVVAKSADVQAKLSRMFEKHEVCRTYLGLLEGVLHGGGTIDRRIVRDPNRRTLFRVAENGAGKRAVTHYVAVKNFSKWTLVRFNLETGRTHQIRVHAKSIGHPIVGDPEYNPSSSIKVDGQMLESVEIRFVHPVSGREIHFEIELSEKMVDILNRIS